MKIPFWSYLPTYDQRRTEILNALSEVFDSGRLILGDAVKTFEKDFAAYTGSADGIGVNSGTDALFLSMKAIGIGPGDDVITVANTAIPTVSAVVATGARPVFVDIDPDTFLMDTSRLEESLTARTKCILPVHLYGQCADMSTILSIANAHDIAVIEDCAQAHGARQHNRQAGSMGRFGAFSFYPTKVLGAFGDGGLITANQAGDAEKLRRIRMYGIKAGYVAEEDGWNSRLDEVQAAILSVGLKYLDADIAIRQKYADVYNETLQDRGLKLPQIGTGNTHVYYAFAVRHKNRREIIAALDAVGIGTNISYPTPIHMMPAYKHLGYGPGDLPQTEAACEEVFSLPLHPGLSIDEVEFVAEIIRKTGSVF